MLISTEKNCIIYRLIYSYPIAQSAPKMAHNFLFFVTPYQKACGYKSLKAKLELQ